MESILRGYSVTPATWFYLSLLLIVAVYFRFSRLWSLRNFDLGLLLSTSPGLLLVEAGNEGDQTLRTVGYTWLFAVSAVLLVRLLMDTALTRRPQFAQNLNGAGMAFLCICTFVFLTAQAITKPPAKPVVVTQDEAAVTEPAPTPDEVAPKAAVASAPPVNPASNPLAGSLISTPVEIVAEHLATRDGVPPEVLAVRILATVAHLAVVLGLLSVGQRLFGDPLAGWAMATLYLLLPCTAYGVGELNHVFPAALIVWAFVAYRKPAVSGVLLGLACGSMFFPLFLLPLWAAFYGRRGWMKFAAALGCVMCVLVGGRALMTSVDANSFLRQAIGTLDVARLAFRSGENVPLFWDEGTFFSIYRIPIIVAYFAMLFSVTVWPRHKTVEHLLAHSAAIIVGTQFWFTQQGGVYLLWYLPLVLMVVFRPRLAHLRPPALEASAQATSTRVLSGTPGTRAGSTAGKLHLFR
ncbi:hypothetical protein Pan44_41970 [Caulifigura coniformis]|uniref:Glycosyltransferase RgtA/B/C/D-like domain-containing protein n=1 Tax=Caulifigura coniformis TaxID=2527983 RepID=A0A517SJ69_9PLAN|nr:hypothetical protein [Caulifigura coniformis]QDT56146.1 hypothetical protein Pan44_41970 [Caulifigura coniformis]